MIGAYRNTIVEDVNYKSKFSSYKSAPKSMRISRVPHAIGALVDIHQSVVVTTNHLNVIKNKLNLCKVKISELMYLTRVSS